MRVLAHFQIPEGVTEITDDYQMNLIHYEILNSKPKGSILFAGENKEVKFQFYVSQNRDDGIIAKVDEPITPRLRQLLDYLSKYNRTEAYVTITLLQFKLMFISTRTEVISNTQNKSFAFRFPGRFLKMHRRKFIRVPLPENLVGELRFQTPTGLKVRRLKDLSREGLRIKIENEDLQVLTNGIRLKDATLVLLNREIPIGVQLVSTYPGNQAGFKIIALSQEDSVWLKDCIKVMIKKMLNLPDAAEVEDQLEDLPEKSEKD